jgi:NADH:ubiquinone oxidoreductase subunit B-like Fe-S oxidoreductase
MVEQEGDIVAPVDVFAHVPSLPQRPDAASPGYFTLKE